MHFENIAGPNGEVVTAVVANENQFLALIFNDGSARLMFPSGKRMERGANNDPEKTIVMVKKSFSLGGEFVRVLRPGDAEPAEWMEALGFELITTNIPKA